VPSPYVGEVRIFAGDYAPGGWAMCDGAELFAGDNPELFGLIGATYGGDGVDTFAVPDLRARVPLHTGAGAATAYSLGDSGGVEQVTLAPGHLPPHAHGVTASTGAGLYSNATGNVLADGSVFLFNETSPDTLMAATAVAPAGGSPNAHENRMPFIALNYIVALTAQEPPDSLPFVGEVRVVAFEEVPSGWARCQGQEIPVEQNSALFGIIGTIYGGDGTATFAVPDISDSVVVGAGAPDGLSTYFEGNTGGAAAAAAEVPTHSHRLRAYSSSGNLQEPGPARSLARSGGGITYQSNVTTNLTTMSPAAVQTTGGSATHNNLQPILVLHHIIALDGQVPPR
jgi:microcystin-dependent protein